MFRLLRTSFLPVLVLLVTSLSAHAQTMELVPVDEPVFGLRSVAPEGWGRAGPGLYARGQDVTDQAVLALQSGEVEPDALLTSLLPQLALTESPEPVGTRDAGTLSWTLYEVEGDTRVTDIALADGGETTYLVVLVSAPDEHAAMHESVFLPAVDALEPLKPEPSASPGERPYRDEEVSFPGGGEGVTLAGTLSLPEGEGPFPVVVLMSGSGPQDRDESLEPMAPIKPFALLADALARNGFAVLRYDDRGVGESTGDYGSAVIDDLTVDGRAAIDYAATRPELDPERIGVLGHSEGGVYLARLAREDPRVAFGIGMAAPATTGLNLLVAQNVSIARADGAPEEDLEHLRQYVEELFATVLEGDREQVEQVTRIGLGELYDRQVAREGSSPTPEQREAFLDAQVQAQLDVMMSDWYRSFLATDFSADWERVTIPILGVFGGKDVQVPPDQEAPALEKALERAGNEDFEIVILPDANHLFQESETGALIEYGQLPASFTPDFLPTLIAWLSEHASVPS
jgi:pimeloyl-ACP methyl ester carboxylesterase